MAAFLLCLRQGLKAKIIGDYRTGISRLYQALVYI